MAHNFYISFSYGATGVILCLMIARTLRAYFSFRKQIEDEFKSEDAAKNL